MRSAEGRRQQKGIEIVRTNGPPNIATSTAVIWEETRKFVAVAEKKCKKLIQWGRLCSVHSGAGGTDEIKLSGGNVRFRWMTTQVRGGSSL